MSRRVNENKYIYPSFIQLILATLSRHIPGHLLRGFIFPLADFWIFIIVWVFWDYVMNCNDIRSDKSIKLCIQLIFVYDTTSDKVQHFICPFATESECLKKYKYVCVFGPNKFVRDRYLDVPVNCDYYYYHHHSCWMFNVHTVECLTTEKP